ncbi:hypothetical protein J7X69_001157 [Serratia marcescens]|uniref:hypothetical protein n=1 Tax=Serratia marcescens TaxID=615 RepID=UPI0027E3DCB7|nr:hypothetical protein [Serratia marcescens]
MKKITVALFLAAGALSLLGCNNHYQPKEQPLQPMPQSYQGVLPCARLRRSGYGAVPG